MNLNEEVELLKGVPILSKIEPAKLKLLAFTSERVNYDEGQELCHQGDPGDAMYVILGGVADVLDRHADRADPGRRDEEERLLGEIAILCDVPRTATIKAREPLNTLKISKDTFYRMVGEFPQMAIEIMRELAHRVEDTNKKLREATANNKAA
jgi:CRP-like cAMP-binding protein